MMQKADTTPTASDERIALVCARSRWFILAVALLLFAGCASSPITARPTPTVLLAATAARAATATPTPSPGTDDTTPTYTPSETLLEKVVAVGPVYVTGDKTAPDEALKDAGLILAAMLRHRPDVGTRLRQHGAFTAVASHDEQICDLRYFSQYNATLCKGFGQGGAGGVIDHPITACDERNLLEEPDDPYQRGSTVYGQNICVHELAHTIMNVGLTPQEQALIENRFLAAQQEGLWTGDYAMTNSNEFWAVMSEFYFSAGPSATYEPEFHHIANGPEKLKQYDPATFALLDAIYQGSTNLS
jgi:hypothetical protein